MAERLGFDPRKRIESLHAGEGSTTPDAAFTARIRLANRIKSQSKSRVMDFSAMS
jgi:hypothetical protein